MLRPHEITTILVDMAEHNDLGKLGEEMVHDHLIKLGHKVLCRNYSFNKAEVDIVTEFNNKLIITEVKTRQSDYLTDPEELVPISKQKQIIKAADQFIKENEIDLDCQFDVYIVIVNKHKKEIRHIEDAFYPIL